MILNLLLVLQSILPITSQQVITPTSQYGQIWGRSIIDENDRRWFCYSQGTDTYIVARNNDGGIYSNPKRVNQETHLQQDECEIYLDRASGKILVVWSDRSSMFTDYMSAMGRGYSVDGVPLTDEFPLFSTYIFPETTWRPIGYPMKNGGFAVVATVNYSEEVGLNIVQADHPPTTPGVMINSWAYSGSNQEYPCVASNNIDDIAVVWMEHNGNAAGGQTGNNLPDLVGTVVRDDVRLFTETPLLGQISSVGAQREPRMIEAGNCFYLVWYNDTTQDIYVRRYNSMMSPISNAIRVNQQADGMQRDPQIFVTRNNSFVVVWESIAPTGASSIQCRWFRDNVTALTGDVQVNTTPVGNPNILVQIDRATPSLFIKSRTMVVTWGGNGSGPGAAKDVFYREFFLE